MPCFSRDTGKDMEITAGLSDFFFPKMSISVSSLYSQPHKSRDFDPSLNREWEVDGAQPYSFSYHDFPPLLHHHLKSMI